MGKTASEIYAEMEDKEYEMMFNNLNKIYFSDVIKPYRDSEKIIDLHVHTNYSDGDLSPQDVIALAIEKRIGTLAITDHDTIEGIRAVNKNDDLIVDSGIEIINGIELSAKVDKGRMHILGYGIDIDDK